MKRYIIKSIYLDWKMIVEIDESNPETINIIKKTVEYWDYAEHVLVDNNYIKAFLDSLVDECFRLSIRFCTMEEIIGKIGKREDWCKMNGEDGIKIIYMDDYEVDLGFEIEEQMTEKVVNEELDYILGVLEISKKS